MELNVTAGQLFFQWTIIAAAFGAGLQNLTVVLMLIAARHFPRQQRSLRQHWLGYGAFIAALALSGIVQRPHDAGKILSWCIGMSSPMITAWYVSVMLGRVEARWRRIALLTVGVVAAVSLGQFLFGVQRQGMTLVWGEHRGYGLYSHPLTLAYVGLLLWVLSVFQLPKFASSTQQKWWMVFTSLIVVTSLSRVVLLLGGLFAAVRFFLSPFRLSQKLIVAFVVAVLASAVLLTPNPISKKVFDTIEGQAGRFASAYPDDRVLFWDVHWRLWKKNPWFGTGTQAPHALRNEIYRELGYDESFIKRYNAHHQFLQIAADGGIVGLSLFLIWLAMIARACWRSTYRVASLSCFILFALASCTQNSLQDNEVRYLVGWLLGCLFYSEASRST